MEKERDKRGEHHHNGKRSIYTYTYIGIGPLRVIEFENSSTRRFVGCLIKGPHFVPEATSLRISLKIDQKYETPQKYIDFVFF